MSSSHPIQEQGEGRAPLRVLLVTGNYAPEHTGIAPYATHTAEHFAARGAQVEVLTGMPHYPAWRVEPAYRRRLRATEQREGVRVHRRRQFVPASQTALRRMLYEATFLAHAGAAPGLRRPDLVVSELPSLAGAMVGARIARRARAPHLVVVQDLMGAAATQSGIAGGDRVASLAGALEGRVLRSAARVAVVHESFTERVRAFGVDGDRIRTARNWTHIEAPTGDRAAVRARLGWGPDETVLLHSGNMGLKQGLHTLVDAARAAAPGTRIVLMGDGSQRAELERAGAGVTALQFLPPADAAEFPDILAAADVLAVTQLATVRDMSLPSKLTSYFAAGRPVVAAVREDSGTAQEVLRSGGGIVVPAEDPKALLAAVASLAAAPAEATRLGEAGAAYVQATLTPEAGLTRLWDLAQEALTHPN